MNIKFLNEVQGQIIRIANENQIILQNEFESVEKFKDFVISFSIKVAMDHGAMTISEAFDFVMGAGSFENLANELWESANSN